MSYYQFDDMWEDEHQYEHNYPEDEAEDGEGAGPTEQDIAGS